MASVLSDHALLFDETVCSWVLAIFFFFITRRATNAITITTSITAPPMSAKLTTAGEPEVAEVLLVKVCSAPLSWDELLRVVFEDWVASEPLEVVVVDGGEVARVVDVLSSVVAWLLVESEVSGADVFGAVVGASVGVSVVTVGGFVVGFGVLSLLLLLLLEVVVVVVVDVEVDLSHSA